MYAIQRLKIKHKKKQRNFKRVNNQIRAREALVIDEAGKNLGILPIREALKKASSKGLDLVEMSIDKDNVPVCKIMDHNKFKYNQKVKHKQAKAKKVEIKELKFGFNIAQGDLDQKINQAKKFIEDGNMVKFTVKLYGRQKALADVALNKFKIIESEMSEIAKIEKEQLNIKKPNNMYIVFMPR